MQYHALASAISAENSDFVENMQYIEGKSLMQFVVAPILHRKTEKAPKRTAKTRPTSGTAKEKNMELERLAFPTLESLCHYLQDACYIAADVTLPARKPNCGTVVSICFEPPFSVELDEGGLFIESRWANFISLTGDFLYASGHTVGEDEDKLDVITVRFAEQEPITLTVIMLDDDF